MTTKKYCASVLLGFSLICYAVLSIAQISQTLQINTHFRNIIGKPTWLLIVRDVNSGEVRPYLFDIRNNDNFWVAFTSGRSYRVTVSNLTFGPYAIINNFCRLEDGILNGQSMVITLSGDLTPVPETSSCNVLLYNNNEFPIVNSQ